MDPLEIAVIAICALGGFGFANAKSHNGRMLAVCITVPTLVLAGSFLPVLAFVYSAGGTIVGIVLGTVVSGLRGDNRRPPEPPKRPAGRRR